MVYAQFVIALLTLIGGAQLLVKGSASIAERFGIPPLIIGLTLVAFGTSSPELAVSAQSAFSGRADLALGNVIGSNIFNVLFVLGLCAMILPLKVSEQLIKQDIPILLGLSILVFVMARDGNLSWLNGLILVMLLVMYLSALVWQGKRQRKDNVNTNAAEQYAPTPSHLSIVFNTLWVALGLGALIFGASYLVSSAVSIAQDFGVSDLVIGLTIVAIGTSLPEVVTSVVAVFNKQRDIAVGNVIGSNIFNLLAVLGATSLLSPTGIPVDISFINTEFTMLIFVALICLPIAYTAQEISRKEGVLLFAIYVGYLGYILLRAFEHPYLGNATLFVLYIIAPICLLTLASFAFKQWQAKAH